MQISVRNLVNKRFLSLPSSLIFSPTNPAVMEEGAPAQCSVWLFQEHKFLSHCSARSQLRGALRARGFIRTPGRCTSAPKPPSQAMLVP